MQKDKWIRLTNTQRKAFYENENLYIFKQNKLYGRLKKWWSNEAKFELYKNGNFTHTPRAAALLDDLYPDGIDLHIMRQALVLVDDEKRELIRRLRVYHGSDKQLLPYLQNTVGDFNFSFDKNETRFLKPILSNFTPEKDEFANILPLKIAIKKRLLYPDEDFKLLCSNMQNLSLGGTQHKLQVSIKDGVIEQDYADYILKPSHFRYENLAVNEHLHTTFMREFGFEVPFNALVFDERLGKYHYIIKRFDIDERADKKFVISLDAMTRAKDGYFMRFGELRKYGTKGEGDLEKYANFLKDDFEKAAKISILNYFYANALLYNSDFHKKNISFVRQNDTLKLSPCYDIINILALTKLEHLYSFPQCCLPINYKKNEIVIRDFKQASDNFGLEFDEVVANLEQISQIYAEKYPLYIDKLDTIPHLQGVAELKERLEKIYKLNNVTYILGRRK